MSHFYASLTSNMSKNERTIRGSKSNGITAHVRSYDVGVWIETSHLADFDIIRVWQTNGTNDDTKTKLIATIKHKTKD